MDNKEVKVFMVYSTFGDFYESWWTVNGVYSTPELAEKRKAEIELWAKQAKDSEPNPKYSEAWHSWHEEYSNYEEFNTCAIDEVVLDKNL